MKVEWKINTQKPSLDWDKINEIMLKHAMSKAKKESHRAEQIVRNLIPCPIKGEITAGKVKWRGLELAIRRNDDGSETKWIHIKPSKSGKRKEFFYPLDETLMNIYGPLNIEGWKNIRLSNQFTAL